MMSPPTPASATATTDDVMMSAAGGGGPPSVGGTTGYQGQGQTGGDVVSRSLRKLLQELDSQSHSTDVAAVCAFLLQQQSAAAADQMPNSQR